MERQFTELRRRIIAYFSTMAEFAEALGISSQTLSNRLNGKTPWRADDISKCCNLLDIEKGDIPIYFLP